MNMPRCHRFLPPLLLALALGYGCVPAAHQADGKTALQEAQQSQATPSPAVPPLQTTLNPEEQGQFRLGYAKLLLDSGQEAEAELILDKLRHDERLAAEVYPLLGRIYEHQGKAREALFAWQKALGLKEGDPILMGKVGRTALLCKDYAVAEAIFNQWLTEQPVGSPLYVSALNNLGFSCLLQKRYDEACRLFDQAIALDPLDKRAKANLALLTAVRAGEREAGPEAIAVPVKGTLKEKEGLLP